MHPERRATHFGHPCADFQKIVEPRRLDIVGMAFPNGECDLVAMSHGVRSATSRAASAMSRSSHAHTASGARAALCALSIVRHSPASHHRGVRAPPSHRARSWPIRSTTYTSATMPPKSKRSMQGAQAIEARWGSGEPRRPTFERAEPKTRAAALRLSYGKPTRSRNSISIFWQSRTAPGRSFRR